MSIAKNVQFQTYQCNQTEFKVSKQYILNSKTNCSKPNFKLVDKLTLKFDITCNSAINELLYFYLADSLTFAKTELQVFCLYPVI